MLSRIVSLLLLATVISFPLNSIAQSQVVTADQVFNAGMINQVWTFQNAYGDQTTVVVLPAQLCEFGVCDEHSVTWFFSKDSPRPWWFPGTPFAELFLVLHQQPDTSWIALGFKWFDGTTQRSAAISTLPGWTGTPYTIIPASSDAPAVNTAYRANWNFGFEDITQIPYDGTWISTWTTYAFVEPTATPLTGMVNALIARKCDGGHSGQCDGAQELWHFCPGVGLCAVEPVTTFDANGNVVRLDPNLTLVRIH